MLDSGEIDQGQRDQPQARLGVSTCGMLVRTAVWTELDGLDPAIPVFRDGVEFGWRAHLNGYRVVTTPERAGHPPAGGPRRTAAARGDRSAAGQGRPRARHGRGRRARPGKMLPLVLLRLVWSCLVHAIGYLLGKVPGRALDEILALGAFVGQPGRIIRLRTRTAAINPVPGTDEVVHTLRPPWWNSLRVAAEAMGGAASDRYRSVAGDADAASLDELTGDDFSSVGEERPQERPAQPDGDHDRGGARGQRGRRPRAARHRRRWPRRPCCPRTTSSLALGRGAGADPRCARTRSPRRGWRWPRSGRPCWPGNRSGSARCCSAAWCRSRCWPPTRWSAG